MAALRSTERGSGARLHCERAEPEADFQSARWRLLALQILCAIISCRTNYLPGCAGCALKRRAFAGDCSLTAGTPRASVGA